MVECMDEIRPTRAVVRILKVFTDKLDTRTSGVIGDHSTEDHSTEDHSTYGYEVMRETGFSSGKTYTVLLRLVKAGWLDRLDNPDADPVSGGPPRITYHLRPEAVPAARRLIAEARKEFAPARKRRSGGPVRAPGWL